jgi:hypothetical protein
MNVEKNDNVDNGLVSLVEEVFAFGRPIGASAATAETLTIPAEVIEPKSRQVTAQILLESPKPPALPVPRRKELKRAAELAAMIEHDLERHPDCPKNGFRVTVYGGGHWRAMLTITTSAGGIQDPQLWRNLTDELADRLRQQYDLAWE